MIRTLRTRLLLSHTLPLLIITLLMGVALDYVVETRILLPGFADELTNEANLLAEVVSTQPDLWDDPAITQAYLDRLDPVMEPHVSIFDSRGQMLASMDPADVAQFNATIESGRRIVEAQDTGVSIRTEYRQDLQANVVDVLVPVTGPGDEMIGLVRMTYHLEDVYRQFVALRYVIVGVLAIGVVIGAATAMMLAWSLGRALQQLTHAVRQLAHGREYRRLPEQGPEEVRDLLCAVNTLVERLRDMENMRRKLLANLVHELGRPLGALLVAIQALRGGAGNDDSLLREILGGMEEEIGILRRLLDDLTGLHDQVLGVLELKTQLVELPEWLPNVLRAQKEAAIAKGLQWQATVPDELPLVEVDPDRLAQAVGNLVHNAIKFTPPGGRVSVEAGAGGSEIWIRVQDTGLGIPESEQAKIFAPFYRSRSENRFPQGMGLGLSIARDLIEAHQGRLEFTSTSGQGSSFTIWLPWKSI